MKVGLISFHSFLLPGGVKRHVLGLHKEFKKRGIQSKIIVPRRSRRENYGKDVILLGTSFPLKFSGSQSDLCINFNPLAINKILKKEKFDVLHFHNFGFPSALQILEWSKALNILTFHANIEGSNFLRNFPGLIYIFNKIAQWKIDGIIGVAPLNLKLFKYYKGPKVVIPNGIDLEEFNPKVPKIKKFLDGKINILFLGRIEERKGLIYLLKAFKILNKNFPNLRLIVVGEGPLKEDCQNWVEKNKLKTESPQSRNEGGKEGRPSLTNIVFEGAAKENEVPSYYTTCDIYCSPAIYGESFGIVLIEAMASGIPVVAFANKGYQAVLEKGKGKRFLVKPRDYKTLAKKLEVLIKNPHLRKEMGEWGIKEAKKYAWPKIADQVLAFYEFCRKNKLKKKK
jgi:phosphatidylinositol alpha-mannosyltransferase